MILLITSLQVTKSDVKRALSSSIEKMVSNVFFIFSLHDLVCLIADSCAGRFMQGCHWHFK